MLAFDRRSANQFTYRRNLLRFAELVGGPFHELIHARMARKHFFLKAPDLTEAVVPQVQTSVGCKHTHCRSEEHTSELQSLMRNSYAVFCLKKKITYKSTYI